MSDYFKRGSGAPKNAATAKDNQTPPSNPVLDEWKKNNPQKSTEQQEKMPAPGDLAASSVFEDDRRIQSQREYERKEQAGEPTGETTINGIVRDPRNMAHVLDPDPNARKRWERKQVIKMVRKGGRLSREQFLKRTEREHTVKSHNLKTSVKKLGMLARQIAGKPLDEAIVQMRFSKKKVAQEVLKQLEFARDEAVVSRGMGLGQISSASELEVAESEESTTPPSPAVEIQLKDGSRHKVADQSRIYIDQAWVGRGPYGKLPDYRARGRIFIMRTPWTSFTVLLKEEATRVREYAEREAKRLKRRQEKLWVPLPDRPVQIQRQWYSW